MKRLLGCILLLGGSLAAQSVDGIHLLALKDSHAARAKHLSDQLVDEMMTHREERSEPIAGHGRAILRGSDRRAARKRYHHRFARRRCRKQITGVLSGKGSTFLPACQPFRDAGRACGIDDRTMQVIVDRFTRHRPGSPRAGRPSVLPVRDITPEVIGGGCTVRKHGYRLPSP